MEERIPIKCKNNAGKDKWHSKGIGRMVKKCTKIKITLYLEELEKASGMVSYFNKICKIQKADRSDRLWVCGTPWERADCGNFPDNWEILLWLVCLRVHGKHSAKLTIDLELFLASTPGYFLLISCVALTKSLNIPQLEFSHRWNGTSNTTDLQLLR